MPKGVLTGLKQQPVSISVVCATLDTGGSSGRLRKDYRIVAPGDIRRALLALANTSPVIKDLFNYRFELGELAGHNFANLLITALELNLNDYKETINQLERLLNVKHHVLPVTLDKSEVCAELENGQIIKGEANIDRPKHDPNLRIKRVFLKPEAQAYPETLEAIKKADLITIGPGDLYSTIAQILLVKGVSQAILESKAKRVYICNLINKKGETNNFSVLDFTNQIEHWLAGELDFVLYNDFFPKERVNTYKKEHPELLEPIVIEDNLDPHKFIAKNLIYDEGPIEHDSQKVSRVLMQILS